MNLNTKQIRSLNKFLRNIGFQEVKNENIQGEFRILGIRKIDDLHGMYDYKIDFEFKGLVKSWGSAWNSLSDYKYYSTIRRNKFVKYKIENEIKNFMRIFNISEKPYGYGYKLGKINWIE